MVFTSRSILAQKVAWAIALDVAHVPLLACGDPAISVFCLINHAVI